MKTLTPENPYRVLLGSSFTLFLALLFSLPIAYAGIALYLSVTNQTLPLQVSPAASVWELRLNPERGKNYEHERLEEELKEAFPGAAFALGVCVTGGDPLDTDPRTHLCVKSMPQMVSNHVVLTFP